MISLKELNPNNYTLTPEQQANIVILLDKINQIRTAYNKPMTVTSGVRSIEDHLRIYHQKGIPANKIPMGSQHLKGAAVDIADPDKALWKWCMINMDLIKEVDLYLEDGAITTNWTHFQIFPPKSGNRIFKP